MTVWIKKYKTGKVRLRGKEQASMPLLDVNVAIIEHNYLLPPVAKAKMEM